MGRLPKVRQAKLLKAGNSLTPPLNRMFVEGLTRCPLLRSLLAAKPTWLFAAQMSAYDPNQSMRLNFSTCIKLLRQTVLSTRKMIYGKRGNILAESLSERPDGRECQWGGNAQYLQSPREGMARYSGAA
jgi:hypothetical protein